MMVKRRIYTILLAIFLLPFLNWSCEKSGNSEGGTATEVETEAPPKPLYNKTATMLSLAWTSYINSGMEGTRAELQSHATNGVQKILTNPNVIPNIGQWSVEWGPITYTHDTTLGKHSFSDNTMMLLKGLDPGTSKEMYVVAIAGTNSSSLFDWQYEDLAATQMVQWPAKPAGDGNNSGAFSHPTLENNPTVTNAGNYISQGITTGLDILLNQMEDKGQTLMAYLKSQLAGSKAPIEIAVTGHSLGGGLSPCVALSLKDNQGYWNTSKSCVISTYPFAGQSPGNHNFAAYFHSQIGSNAFQGTYNTMDVVPHGFQQNMMVKIPTLYENVTPKPNHLGDQCVILGLVNCVKPSIDKFNYTSLYNSTNTFTYNVVYNDSAYQAGLKGYENITFKEATAIRYLCGTVFSAKEKYARSVNFANIASIQHLDAYITNYGIQKVEAVIRANQLGGMAPSFASIIDAPLFDNCWP